MSTTPLRAAPILVVCLLLAPGAVAGASVAPLDGNNTTDSVEGTVNDTVENTTEAVETTTETANDTVENTSDDAEQLATETIEALESATDDETSDVFDRDSPNVTTTASTETAVVTSVDSDGRVAYVPTEDSPLSDSSLLTDADSPDGRNATGSGDGADSGSAPDLPPGGVVGGVGLAGVVAVALRQGALVPGGLTTAVRTAVSPATAAGSDALDRLLRTFYPLRYSRYDDSDPLEHEARVEMLDVVETEPGTYLSEVSERAGLPLSTTRHHMRVLEQEELVASATVRGRRRFYPGGAEGLELAAAMNDEATARLLDALARLGPSSVSALAEELDRDPSTITHHLKRLETDGVVVRERDGRAIVNSLSPEAAEALDPVPDPAERTENPVSAD